ncbi:hypothetical protein QYM36_003093 [Artemia franciscana]|uniref:Envelope fusion protein n=1 Tax=Artemia franciscana TaxID=6661 RepID=A0AA88I7K6_ARTSF|nr:hypothetical protein QYM36_003093 [Artemia franciscana]
MLLSERREASVDVNIQLAMQQLSSAITEISLEFSQVELAFLTILTRRLPAQLIDPPKLVEILKNIEKNLPYHLSLGLEPTHENILYLYSVVTTQLEVQQGELLIALKVPLVRKEEYMLYQINPFSAKIANTTWRMRIKNLPPYIVISSHSYMLPDRADVLLCQRNKLPFCKLDSVTYVQSQRICTIQLLEEVDGTNPLPKECEAEIIGNVKLELWKQVSETDFILSVPKLLNAQFKGQNYSRKGANTDISTSGIGILTVSPSCQLSTKEALIVSPVAGITNVFHNSLQIRPFPEMNIVTATGSNSNDKNNNHLQKIVDKLNSIAIPDAIPKEHPKLLTTVDQLKESIEFDSPIFQTEKERISFYNNTLLHGFVYFFAIMLVLYLANLGIPFFVCSKYSKQKLQEQAQKEPTTCRTCDA